MAYGYTCVTLTIMRISNKETVKILKEALAAMEVKNVNRFRIRAYQNAIAVIDNLTTSVYDLWENNRLNEISGVGSGLEQHLSELFTTGKVAEYEKLKSDLPAGMFELIGIRGIGAKKAFKLAKAFHLNSRDTAVEQLKQQAEQHKIQVLEGFGEKSEQDILEAIQESKKTKKEKQRLLLFQAEEISNRLLTYLRELPEVADCQALGSLRRRESTVGDLDIAISTQDSPKVLDYFLKYPEIGEVLVQGDKKISVVLKNDVQVDVRTIELEAYGSMLQYFTGSKTHNVILRSYALEKGMSLSEYGIKIKNKLVPFSTEEAFYQQLEMQYIPPELRQGKNEVELARKHQLPNLVELADIHGDMHIHTTSSPDASGTLKEMVNECRRIGYEYAGITDHNPSIQSRSLHEIMSSIKVQQKEIASLNTQNSKFHVLFGMEVSILADASLALPNSVLEELDFVVASIHSAMTQTREQLTNRLIKAIEHPLVTIIGHPSNRLINERDACDIDWEKVFNTALKYNKILEINAQPRRLDMADDLVRDAVKKGIKLVISSDSHSVDELKLMHYGLDVARRGGCTSANIINTWKFAEFKKLVVHNRY